MAVETLMCAADGCISAISRFEEFGENQWEGLEGNPEIVRVDARSAISCPLCGSLNEVVADGFRGKPRVVGVMQSG